MQTIPSILSTRVASTLLLAALAFGAPGHAQKAWTLDFVLGGPVSLSLLDVQTAESEIIAPVQLVDVYAMARGVEGDFWIIARATFTPSVVALHRLDSETFTLTEVGPLNLPSFVDIRGMTVLPDGRILMSADFEPSVPPGLYDVDPATGQGTLIGNTAGLLTA
ncbi:MAG: hypothetical protein AAGF23_17225, partial [Acidobacteriota bacterium]